MDRIDAYKALAGHVTASDVRLQHRLHVQGSSTGRFEAPDFLEVALCSKDGSLLRYASRAMLCRSLCGRQEVVLYKGDYYPVHRDSLAVGPYIVVEEV